MPTSDGTRKSPPFRFTERDYLILEDIARCGGLTAEQIGRHHFGVAVFPDMAKVGADGNHPLKVAIHSNCQRRLKLFKDAKLVRRIERYQLLSEGKKPYLYTLTRSGAQSLADYMGCKVEETGWRERETRLRPNYIEHHILIADIRLAVMRALTDANLQLVAWHDEVTLAKTHNKDVIELKRSDGTTEQVKLLPDAYFAIQTADGVIRHHFLEIDRGTESTMSGDATSRTFSRKVATYVSYFRTVHQVRYGSPNGRVLTVTTSQKRLARLRDATEQAGGAQRFWFAAHAALIEPSVEAYVITEKKTGLERVAYRGVMPNIWTQGAWFFAKDKTSRAHALGEFGEQLRT